MSAFIGACVARGQRLGDVKPVSLSAATGWRDHLPQLDVEAGMLTTHAAAPATLERLAAAPAQAGEDGIDWRTPIDRSRWFFCETLTPLYYTSGVPGCSAPSTGSATTS